MRVLLQRVREASVTVDGRVVGAVGHGFCLLVGFTHGDTDREVAWMADKVATLRVFEDDQGKMNRALGEVGGGVLVVSQFTLYADAAQGRRPSFVAAARPEAARGCCDRFVAALAERGLPVATGEFGAMMQVALVNDGPVTIWLERVAPAPAPEGT